MDTYIAKIFLMAKLARNRVELTMADKAGAPDLVELPLTAVVDCHGRPVTRSASGGWPAAFHVMGLEMAQRFAFYGSTANLMSYMTGPLRQSNAAAAAALNTWSGATAILSLPGAAVADAWLGRFKAVVAAAALYLLGYGMLTASRAVPALTPPPCAAPALTLAASAGGAAPCVGPTAFQLAFFYAALLVVGLAMGLDKAACLPFGADQFDEAHAAERAGRASFFNWWYFAVSAGITISVPTMSYVQDNVGWELGFGIPCAVMVAALAAFLLGTGQYRCFAVGSSPIGQLGAAAVSALRRWFRKSDEDDRLLMEQEEGRGGAGSLPEIYGEAVELLRLLPVGSSSIVFAVIFAQINTFFTKQAMTLDRRITDGFTVPPAAVQCIGAIVMFAFVPAYDRVIVPVARRLTRQPSGITTLQRIGAGMAAAAICVAVAALVEGKRLAVARYHGIIDDPSAAVPMALWWLMPQFALIGVAELLFAVGMQEFFYAQVPYHLRSFGSALYISLNGVGSFVSGAMVPAIDAATRSHGGESWFADNLNRAHLDYFYWLLAALAALQLLVFFHCARNYEHRKSAVS